MLPVFVVPTAFSVACLKGLYTGESLGEYNEGGGVRNVWWCFMRTVSQLTFCGDCWMNRAICEKHGFSLRFLHRCRVLHVHLREDWRCLHLRGRLQMLLVPQRGGFSLLRLRHCWGLQVHLWQARGCLYLWAHMWLCVMSQSIGAGPTNASA